MFFRDFEFQSPDLLEAILHLSSLRDRGAEEERMVSLKHGKLQDASIHEEYLEDHPSL